MHDGELRLQNGLVNKTYPQNTFKNIKRLKIQHLLNNLKKCSSCDQYPPKIQTYEIKNPQNTPLIPVIICVKSTL